jgi:L-2-hydroxyglutarate oxidase LhgO
MIKQKRELQRFSIVIIGAGIIGLTIARELVKQGIEKICILEKESSLGCHASGRNSGVLHAGVYYTPNSNKAKYCVEGNQLMKAFCKDHGLPMRETGKVIVTSGEEELATLHELEMRAKASGSDVKLISESELKKIEPHAHTHDAALHVRSTALVDPASILDALKRELTDSGKVEFKFGEKFESRLDRNRISTSNGQLRFEKLINAAGAFADKVAHAFGLGEEYTILPIKGTYLKLRSAKSGLVNGNIYPVPDLQNPFLGVHFTKSAHRDVYVGPTAIPAFGRENYRGFHGLGIESFSIAFRDLSLFAQNQAFRRAAISATKKLNRGAIFKDAKKLLPTLNLTDLQKTEKVGIRPQLVHKTSKQLVMDFLLLSDEVSVHVLNAISPAFTSSMAFAKQVVSILLSMRPKVHAVVW